MNTRRLPAMIVLLCMLLAACAGPDSAPPSPAPTETPAPALTPAPTTKPTPRPTPSPTPEPLPRIKLREGAELEWFCGVPFTDPGFEAFGPEGEDRSPDVTVEGAVTAWRVGDYTLCYRLVEDGETLAEAERHVRVVPQTLPETVEPPKGTICLTFDDGPGEYTAQLLDILAKYDIKATFFIVARHLHHRDLLTRIADEGHTIGIHCFNHDDYGMLYLNEKRYFEDFMSAQEVVYEYTGRYAHVARFPGGGPTASYLAGLLPGGYDELYGRLRDMGVREYDWNVQPESATKTTEGTLVSFTHPRRPYEYAVVLQHDTRSFSIAAVERMIVWALDEGYTFASLDETFPEIHITE